MTDVRTYTAHSTLPPWAHAITDTIRRGDLDKARSLFRAAAGDTSIEDTVYAVAAVVEPGPGRIIVGEAPLVFGNPLREGFAWRCGECLAVFRRGGPDPHAGVNYKTLRGAANAAHKHATGGHTRKIPVREVTR